MNDKRDGWTWKSADSEAETEVPPRTNRPWVVPRRTPAESARATAAWFRAKWIKLTTVLVVLALAIGGWQTYTYLTRYHEQMSGPHGDFPAALGSSAPLRPAHSTRFSATPEWVSGGLSLYKDMSGRGLTARGLRTDKSYWHYARKDTELLTATASEDTAVLWFGDGVVVGVDLRSGKPRWHVKVPGETDRNESRSWYTEGTVLLGRPDSVIGLSVRDGERLWSAPPPKGCRSWDDRAPIYLKDVLAFDAVRCSQGSERDSTLFGLGRDTGRIRWHITDPVTGYGRLDDHTLAALTVRSSLVVTDVSDDRPRSRSTQLSNEVALRGMGDDTVLLDTDDSTSLMARRVNSDGSSKVIWTRKADGGRQFGNPGIADGRVYVVQSRAPVDARRKHLPGDGRLLVLDSHSGRELHRSPLPESLFTEDDFWTQSPAIRGVGSGVVLIGWNDIALSSTELALFD
ncbi:PQQ-binding-like beta-propeller repeat protein [Streptomyces sp. NPDC051320]|uniref:outer membrane protein assembly factor BamB family protein n=1 Tax=Streptomyces sp. NPDC051320 TaxID=3154644 RepID=UPI00344124FB